MYFTQNVFFTKKYPDETRCGRFPQPTFPLQSKIQKQSRRLNLTMERPATLLHIEAAASGRSRCGVCKERIPQGSDRIGTQRKYPFRGFLCTTWHHRQCFELPWALGLDEAIQPVTPEAKKAFTKAARLVVAPGIRELREDALKGNPKCPITGDELDSSNSHVHHYGPYDFDNIVMSFVSKFRVPLHRVSYTAAQFSNDELATAFAAFHDAHKRYLLVHKSANQGILKKRPNFGPCDVCSTCDDLTWIFHEGVCDTCRATPMYRRRFLSSRQCLREFGLGSKDLSGLKFQSMPNPIHVNFAAMRLYRREDVEKKAEDKFGSVDLARGARQDKAVEIHKRRKRLYELARGFHMKLRKPRSTSIAVETDDELATVGQLRYMRQLGIAAVAGISKSSASEAISARKRRKCVANPSQI